MKLLKNWLVMIIILTSLIGILHALMPGRVAASVEKAQTSIMEWKMMWENPDNPLTIEEVSAISNNENWFKVHANGDYPNSPEGVNSAWIKFDLPELTYKRPTMYLDKVFAREVLVYVNNKPVVERVRDYPFNRNNIIVPLSQIEAKSAVFLYITSPVSEIGIQQVIRFDEIDRIINFQVKENLFDIILGASLIFIAIFSFIIILFINKLIMKEWYSFCLVMLCIGLLILTYSPFFHNVYTEIGYIAYTVFDIASNLLLPSLFLFFESIFGRGPLGLIRKMRIINVALATIFIAMQIAGFYSDSINHLYFNVFLVLFGISIIVNVLILTGLLIYLCRNKNEEAIIVTTGFGFFACTGIGEIIFFFTNGRMYQLFIWKIGVFVFLASLMIILVRKAMTNYKLVLAYSKQLEIYNIELQRSEKMETISQLAASVAHEVRNPLQVTRGFLQIVGNRTQLDKDKQYMHLAIDELDRASEIITDFLTFAKPSSEMNTIINIREELQQIEAILVPMAIMQGGTIIVVSSFDAYVKGNSSKFKQVLMNIVKNSIEAMKENGLIRISITEVQEANEVLVCIEDNGEGMDPIDLKHLGEPFYSRKSKGTGLGLMVTFRIIEAMNGRILYESEKGIGTTVRMYFPLE